MYLQTNLKHLLSNHQASYLQRYDAINCHAGCVNSVKFYRDQDNRLYLISGSDDRHLGFTSIEPTINSTRIDLSAKHRGNIISVKTFQASGSSNSKNSTNYTNPTFHTSSTVISAANKGTVCATDLTTQKSSLIHDDSKRIVALDTESNYFGTSRNQVIYYSDGQVLKRHDLSDRDGEVFINKKQLDDETAYGPTAIAVNEKRPFYLAVGCRNGSTKIFDVRWSKQPLFGKKDTGVDSLEFDCAYSGKKGNNDHRVTSLAWSKDGTKLLANAANDLLLYAPFGDNRADFSLQKNNGLNKSDGGSFPAPKLKASSKNYKTDESSTPIHSAPKQFTQGSQVTSTNSTGFSSNPTSSNLKNNNTFSSSSSSKIRKHSLEQKTSTRSNSASDDGRVCDDEMVGGQNNNNAQEVNPRGTLTYQDRSDGVGQRRSDSLVSTRLRISYGWRDCGPEADPHSIITRENLEQAESTGGTNTGQPQNVAVERNEQHRTQTEEVDRVSLHAESDPSQSLSAIKNISPPPQNSNSLGSTTTTQSNSANHTLLRHSRNAGQSRNYKNEEKGGGGEEKAGGCSAVTASDRITPTINDITTEGKNRRNHEVRTAKNNEQPTPTITFTSTGTPVQTGNSLANHDQNFKNSSKTDQNPDSVPELDQNQNFSQNFQSYPDRPRRNFSTKIPVNHFTGHRNKRTTCKQAIFYGENDEFIISGSECGHFFVWRNSSSPDGVHQASKPIAAYLGDSRVVNSLDTDGYLLASSGIERTVKLWRPNFGGGGDSGDFLLDKLSGEGLDSQVEKNGKFNEKAEGSVNVPIQLLAMLRRLTTR